LSASVQVAYKDSGDIVEEFAIMQASIFSEVIVKTPEESMSQGDAV
jgi:hypothetical protein